MIKNLNLKAKTLILTGALLLSSVDVFGSNSASPAKNPAEAKYQALLSTRNYDDLTTFLQQMVNRMKNQQGAAEQAEKDLKDDPFADEMELRTAHDDAIAKQFAVKFWQDRLDAVASLKTAAAQDQERLGQVNSILPRVRELTTKATEERHEANAAYIELGNFLNANRDFLRTIDGLEGVPDITAGVSDKQALQDAAISKYQKSVEAYLLKFKQEAEAREAANKDAAAAVARSSKNKQKKLKKDVAAAGDSTPSVTY